MEDYPPDVLRQILHFDSTDLRENRARRLSARQIERLTWARRVRLVRCLCYGLGSAIFSLFLILFLNALNGSSLGNYVVGIAIFGAFSLVFLDDFRWNWSGYRLLGEDIARQQVGVLEGKASVWAKRQSFQSNNYNYFLDVKNSSFPISRTLYYPLKQESWCRVYYTSSAHYVLAVERARDVEAARRDDAQVNVHAQ
jgi:hypothetical protein